jgi:hypothetical protein
MLFYYVIVFKNFGHGTAFSMNEINGGKKCIFFAYSKNSRKS